MPQNIETHPPCGAKRGDHRALDTRKLQNFPFRMSGDAALYLVKEGGAGERISQRNMRSCISAHVRFPVTHVDRER